MQQAKSVYNLLWLKPKFKIPEGLRVDPMPSEVCENIVLISNQNSRSDVLLWIDSRQIVGWQHEWISKLINLTQTRNLQIRDLNEIPEYASNELFERQDESSRWRKDKHALIWRQVDVAKILVCLQGNYEQTFYSDTDVVNLSIESQEIQGVLGKFGFIVGGIVFRGGFEATENQAFGFDRTYKNVFEDVYSLTLQEAQNGRNGYLAFRHVIEGKMVGYGSEVVFKCRYNSPHARHLEEGIVHHSYAWRK